MDNEPIRLPGPTHKTAIVGRNGSGKTLAGLWHLSEANFDERPWIILDFKRDEHINGIERAEVITYDEIPDLPGIYILNPMPGDHKRMEEWLHAVWERENLGIFIDEGYMIDQRSDWFNWCLTQGRSKRLQMIILSQRPCWMSRFVFSEADFFQIFDLTHVEDMDKVREYIRDDERLQLEKPLEHYHSYYYDVGRRRLETFRPVPEPDELLAKIDARLAELELVDDQGEERPRRRAF